MLRPAGPRVPGQGLAASSLWWLDGRPGLAQARQPPPSAVVINAPPGARLHRWRLRRVYQPRRSVSRMVARFELLRELSRAPAHGHAQAQDAQTRQARSWLGLRNPWGEP